ILGRAYGLTSDHLLGAEIVLADGRLVQCDGDHHGDLFWALRGAGAGQFGVVTSLVFRTRRAPSATSFRLSWPYRSSAALIEAWQGWAPTAPGELYASLLLSAGAHSEEPPPADVVGSMPGSEDDAPAALEAAPARRGGGPT